MLRREIEDIRSNEKLRCMRHIIARHLPAYLFKLGGMQSLPAAAFWGGHVRAIQIFPRLHLGETFSAFLCQGPVIVLFRLLPFLESVVDHPQTHESLRANPSIIGRPIVKCFLKIFGCLGIFSLVEKDSSHKLIETRLELENKGRCA